MDENVEIPSTSKQTLTAEPHDGIVIRDDGQLQIVEVSKFNKSEDDEGETIELQTSEGTKYVQVTDASGKGLMQLDLLNLTLVRCGDGEDEYRLISNDDAGEGSSEFMSQDTTVTCVLQSSDGEDQEGQESYVMVEGEQDQDAQESYVMVQDGQEIDEQESYVMVDSDQGPVVYLQSDWKKNYKLPKPVEKQTTSPKTETTLELLERAQALHKAKELLRQSMRPARGRGRRPKHLTPEPQELLSSPNFKLFLYNCKFCTYKCNAIRDLTRHRKSAHGSAAQLGGRGGRVASSTLQCARCPYRGTSHYQLLRHVQDNHMDKSKEETVADVLVCGGCGFESTSRQLFKKHIELKHPPNTQADDDS